MKKNLFRTLLMSLFVLFLLISSNKQVFIADTIEDYENYEPVFCKGEEALVYYTDTHCNYGSWELTQGKIKFNNGETYNGYMIVILPSSTNNSEIPTVYLISEDAFLKAETNLDSEEIYNNPIPGSKKYEFNIQAMMR